MKINAVSASTLSFKGRSKKVDNSENNKKANNKFSAKDSVLTALGLVGTALGAILVAKPDVVGLDNIRFVKGIASYNGERFSGTIQDVLSSGDSIALKYLDGIIQESQKVSADGVSVLKKIYTHFQDGSCAIDTYNNKTKITTHSYRGANNSAFSVFEEDFSRNTMREVCRLNQDAKTGAFLRRNKAGDLQIGVKQNGNWQSHRIKVDPEQIYSTTIESTGRKVLEFDLDKLLVLE